MTEEPTSAASPVVAHEVAHRFARRYVRVRTLVRLLVVALFVALALVLVRARGHSEHGGLAPNPARLSLELEERYLGVHQWYGLVTLKAQGDRPVTLDSTEFLHVDPGLDVRGVWAVDSPCLGMPSTVVGDAGALRRQYPSLVLHRVRGVVVRPDQPYRWCLLAEVVATRLGTHRFEGVRVRWKGGSTVYRYVWVLHVAHSGCGETFLANDRDEKGWACDG